MSISCLVITHLISGLILVRPLLNDLNFAFLSPRNDPFRNILSLTTLSFSVDLREQCVGLFV